MSVRLGESETRACSDSNLNVNVGECEFPRTYFAIPPPNNE